MIIFASAIGSISRVKRAMQPMRRSKIKGCTGLCRVTKAETAINNCRKVKFGGIVNTDCGKAAFLRSKRFAPYEYRLRTSAQDKKLAPLNF